jgi:hypothetical protein
LFDPSRDKPSRLEAINAASFVITLRAHSLASIAPSGFLRRAGSVSVAHAVLEDLHDLGAQPVRGLEEGDAPGAELGLDHLRLYQEADARLAQDYEHVATIEGNWVPLENTFPMEGANFQAVVFKEGVMSPPRRRSCVSSWPKDG